MQSRQSETSWDHASRTRLHLQVKSEARLIYLDNLHQELEAFLSQHRVLVRGVERDPAVHRLDRVVVVRVLVVAHLDSGLLELAGLRPAVGLHLEAELRPAVLGTQVMRLVSVLAILAGAM